jgi:hypothetical protein
MELKYDNCTINISFNDGVVNLKTISKLSDFTNMPQNARLKSDIDIIENSDIVYIDKIVCDDSSKLGSGLELFYEALKSIKALPRFKRNIIVTLMAAPLEKEGRLTTRRRFATEDEATASLMRYYSLAGFIEVYGFTGVMYGHIDEILSKCQSELLKKAGSQNKSRSLNQISGRSRKSRNMRLKNKRSKRY